METLDEKWWYIKKNDGVKLLFKFENSFAKFYHVTSCNLPSPEDWGDLNLIEKVNYVFLKKLPLYDCLLEEVFIPKGWEIIEAHDIPPLKTIIFETHHSIVSLDIRKTSINLNNIPIIKEIITDHREGILSKLGKSKLRIYA
jgi:hypothetical protein